MNVGLRAHALTQPTYSPSLARKRESGVWQRRFWEHTIRDDRDFRKHVNYIHYNPVKHKYVKSPVEWRYSSIHTYIQRGLLAEDWSADEDVYE